MARNELRHIIELLTEIRDAVKGQAPVQAPVQKPVPAVPANSFDQFWAAYPRKIGKGAAELAWKKLKPDQALVQQILSSVAAQKSCEQWKKDQGQYIPHPSTWLNGKRWLDQHAVEVQAKPPVMYKEHKPLPQGVPPPPEVAEALSRLLGKSMTFPGQG